MALVGRAQLETEQTALLRGRKIDWENPCGLVLSENEGRRMAPVILCARGTPTMKRWSFDARSGGSLEAALPREG